MAERDPKATPEFGDVFVWRGEEDDPVMFLHNGEDWIGLSLRTGGVTTGYQSLTHPSWVFVGNAKPNPDDATRGVLF